MATEYYMVKPSKKEIYYLGKHIMCPDGIPEWKYNEEATYIDYECWDDFFWDFLKENYHEFVNTDYTLENLQIIIYKLYNWCEYDKVYFDNDCHDGAEWLDWKETGSLFPTNEELSKEEIKEELDEINKELIYRDIYESHVTTDGDKAEILKVYPHFAECKDEPMEKAKFLFDGNEEKAEMLLDIIWKYAK